MFCHNCGAALADRSPFCGSCGTAARASRIVARAEGPPHSAVERVGKVPTGMKKLLIAGYVSGFVALLFLPPAFGLAGIVIGIIALAKGRVGHGIALIVIAVTCGFFGMYIGWIGLGNLLLQLQTPVPSRSTQSPAAQPIVRDWHVVSIESRVTESNNVYSVYSWKLTIRNDSAEPAVFHGWVEFQDSDGFKLADDAVNIERDIQVPAASEGVFTGSRDIENTKQVARTVAKISKER